MYSAYLLVLVGFFAVPRSDLAIISEIDGRMRVVVPFHSRISREALAQDDSSA